MSCVDLYKIVVGTSIAAGRINSSLIVCSFPDLLVVSKMLYDAHRTVSVEKHCKKIHDRIGL